MCPQPASLQICPCKLRTHYTGVQNLSIVYIQGHIYNFVIFWIFGCLVKSLREAVLWENVGAEMLIGCVRNFLVLRICYKVAMGHDLSGFHVFPNLLFW